MERGGGGCVSVDLRVIPLLFIALTFMSVFSGTISSLTLFLHCSQFLSFFLRLLSAPLYRLNIIIRTVSFFFFIAANLSSATSR